MFRTYKYFDNQGRRLAIFYDNNVLTAIPCSKKVQFNKTIAKELYSNPHSFRYTHEGLEIKSIHDFIKTCDRLYTRYKYITLSKNSFDTEIVKGFKGKYYIRYKEY